MQAFRGPVAKFIWAAILVVGLADMMLYMKRSKVTDEFCCTAPPPAPGISNDDAHPQPEVFVNRLEGQGKEVLPNYRKSGLINSTIYCEPTVPCAYPEETDFRIIVISYNRDKSLKKLLETLDKLELDGDIAMLEIWIDRSKDGKVHANTVKVAEDFHWSKGRSRVHVQKKHVGIYGQWIDTWRPRASNTYEIALILEDDLSISPYTYRWLKAARDKYGGRGDIAGYTLQSEGVNKARGSGGISAPKGDMAFMYKLMGSWGFAPHPKAWREFQGWYQKMKNIAHFHPYVDGLKMTSWYKSFEKKQTHDSMWTMWFIYFCEKNNLFTVYNNICKAGNIKKGFLAQNRQEPGLHFGGKGKEAKNVLNVWDSAYGNLPERPVMIAFDGKIKQQS